MKTFISLQPKQWQVIYASYLKYADSPEIATKFIDVTKQDLLEKGFTEDQATNIANALLTTFINLSREKPFIETDDNPDINEARLSLYDIKLLKQKLIHEPSQDLKRLLVTYLVYARANPHPSFWIKNDKKVINFLASLQKLKVSEQILLTNRLHNLYNLDMQVVGSNQPIPCFKIAWQADQPPIDTPENPLVLLGPLNPATIKAFAEQIPYEEEEEDSQSHD